MREPPKCLNCDGRGWFSHGTLNSTKRHCQDCAGTGKVSEAVRARQEAEIARLLGRGAP